MLKNSSLNISPCNLIYTIFLARLFFIRVQRLTLAQVWVYLKFQMGVESMLIKCCHQVQRILEKIFEKIQRKSIWKSDIWHFQPSRMQLLAFERKLKVLLKVKELSKSLFTYLKSLIRGPHSEVTVFVLRARGSRCVKAVGVACWLCGPE